MKLDETQASNNFQGPGHEQGQQQQQGKEQDIKVEEDLDDFTNIDDFLSDIWATENPNAAATMMDDPMFPINNATIPMPAPPLPLIQHPTLHQVSTNIQNQQPPRPLSHIWDSMDAASSSSLAKMTLEHCFLKAGILPERGSSSTPALPMQPTPFELPNFQMDAQGPGFNNPIMGMKYDSPQNSAYMINRGYQLGGNIVPAVESMQIMEEVPSQVRPTIANYLMAGKSQQVCSGQGSGVGNEREKRGVLEVQQAIERRRKRMIKNRESAARSRARKQAYTVGLEGECDRIRKENETLELERQELLRRIRQELIQSMDEKARINSQKNARALRRCKSCT